MSKAACTDSDQGREIERRTVNELEYGIQRFHRGISLTLLILATLILVIELCRTGGLYPRIVIVSALALFCLFIQRLSASLLDVSRNEASHRRI